MKKVALLAIAMAFAQSGVASAASEKMLISCGSSLGKAYRFDGKGWQTDGMSEGKIFLIENTGGVEGEFDIRFSDGMGEGSYVADGAAAFKVQQHGSKHSFIAGHSNYTDQFTFDVSRKELVWTSHRINSPYGEKFQRVAIYYAECGE